MPVTVTMPPACSSVPTSLHLTAAAGVERGAVEHDPAGRRVDDRRAVLVEIRLLVAQVDGHGPVLVSRCVPPPFNPFDPAFRADPYPFYARLREPEPVHVSPLGFVVLTRYEDVARTLRGNEFSRDIEANASTDRQDPAREHAPRAPAPAARGGRRGQEHPQPRPARPHPPAPAGVAGLHAVGDRAAAAAASRRWSTASSTGPPSAGSMELVDELAFPVPFQVISDLLGMPTEREVEMRDWSQTLTAALEPTADEDDAGRRRAPRSALVGRTSTTSSPTAAGTSATTCSPSCSSSRRPATA